MPPRSFILHGLFLVDGAGVPCEKKNAQNTAAQDLTTVLAGAVNCMAVASWVPDGQD